MNRLYFHPAAVLTVVAALGIATSVAACGSPPKAPETQSAPSEASSPPPSAPAADQRAVIVALGDSLTAGLGVDTEMNYPARLQRRIDAAGYRYRVVNAGISGETTSQGANRLRLVRELDPVIVILALGANDGLRGLPVQSTYRNLEKIVNELKAGGVRVILAGMQMPPNYGDAYTQEFRSIFPDLARKHDLAFVPFLLEGVAGKAELNQEDGIHPTAKGYELIAENVWQVLEPMLEAEARSQKPEVRIKI